MKRRRTVVFPTRGKFHSPQACVPPWITHFRSVIRDYLPPEKKRFKVPGGLKLLL